MRDMSGAYRLAAGVLPMASAISLVKWALFPQHKPIYCTPASLASVAYFLIWDLQHSHASNCNGKPGSSKMKDNITEKS